jgi:hypothetical protein
MKQEQQFYKDRTVGPLSNFQLLELTLKLYIGTSYDYIYVLVSGRIHFDFSIDDVENYPLERLLNVFGKLNKNKELKKRLNKLKKERNYIAHEALLVTIGLEPNMETLHKKAEDFFYLEDELMECLKLVTEEFRQLKVNFALGEKMHNKTIKNRPGQKAASTGSANVRLL